MAINPILIQKSQNLHRSKVSENKEHIRLIWLDENMNDSSDYFLKTALLEINPSVQFYSDFNRCFDLIKSIKNELIFLIFSGDFTQHLSILTQIYNHQNVIAIFILSTNHQNDLLSKTYNKIVGIFIDQDSLLNVIREKMNLIEQQILTCNVFNQEQNDQSRSLFVRHQLLIYILKLIPLNEQSIEQMLDMCRNYYQNNKHEMKKIEEFIENYSHEKAIEWFTDKCFLYKLLNKALYTEDIEVLYTFRFFIIDLCTAIEQKYHDLKNKSSITLYRGTQMSTEEIQKFKDNIDKVISMNGFLLASRSIDISLQMARLQIISNDYQPVLFEIQVDPLLKTGRFADVENQSHIEDRDQIIFNLNVLFKIHSINFDTTLNLWKVQLNTTDEGTEKIQEHLLSCQHDRIPFLPIIYFGYLLMNELDQINRVEKYFNMLLKLLPFDHPDIANIYLKIGDIHSKRNESDLALKNYTKANELCQQQKSLDHLCIADSFWSIALIHSKKGNYDLALDYYQKALNIFEQLYPDDNVQKAMIIDNIGRIYGNKGDFNMALMYLTRALDMYKHVLPEQHHDIARCLGQIGYIYENKKDLKVALNYYHQQLNIEEKCLPFDHFDLIIALQLIVDTYKKMGEINKGLEFCQEKLNIQKNKWGDSHPHTIRTLMIIASVLKTNDPSKALEYYEQARSILESSTLSSLQTTSECLTSIASLYAYFNMFDHALECELKALNLYQQILPSDHPDITTSLRNIGICYVKMNKPSETLRYFNESLSIFKANFGEEHGEVKRLQTDIVKIKNILMLTTISHKPDGKNSKKKYRRS